MILRYDMINCQKKIIRNIRISMKIVINMNNILIKNCKMEPIHKCGELKS